ncbi:hypothetical protein GCM10010503_36910 [Streptomyces lucensis JCM 4490]|uniref:Uncharacterized protein n=1 Tax=Streptomyces lucensis JCM 4490 TaxID=1306176 RepID=A0A918J7C1_9ACTN|nr:hypothetical protein [Streptomyces lucensis]GGW56401.1 hypothetical protein GCM10010503_36910 [Streptomyces lucensis JCM 4490]
MSAARLGGALVPVSLLVIAVVGIWWVLRQERRRPSSHARRGVPVHLGGEPSPEEWRQMSTEAQGAYDTAVLNAAESAETTAARSAD